MRQSKHTRAAEQWLENKGDAHVLAFIVLTAQLLEQLGLLTDVDRRRVVSALDEAGFLRREAA
jgi:hypothetical protein